MTSSNGDIFRVVGHLCGEFTGSRWIPRSKASDAEFWYFLWSVWINGLVNNREAGDLRRYRAHYDVTVMGTGEVQAARPKKHHSWMNAFSNVTCLIDELFIFILNSTKYHGVFQTIGITSLFLIMRSGLAWALLLTWINFDTSMDK